MNMNELFGKLTNFKIKFKKDPSPVQIANMPIRFDYRFREIELREIYYDKLNECVCIGFANKEIRNDGKGK